MTYPRLLELVELHNRTRGQDLEELGRAVNLAIGDPKKLRHLNPANRRSTTNADVPPQLRIPRKRGAEASHG